MARHFEYSTTQPSYSWMSLRGRKQRIQASGYWKQLLRVDHLQLAAPVSCILSRDTSPPLVSGCMKWATLLHPLHHLRTCHKLGIWDTPFPHTCDWVVVQHLMISPSLLNPIAVNPSRPCIPDGLAPKLQPGGKTSRPLHGEVHQAPLEDCKKKFLLMSNCGNSWKMICKFNAYNVLPVVPHKAVAEVSKIGNL